MGNRTLRTLVVCLFAAAAAAPASLGCQQPPQISCDLVAASVVLRHDQPFDVIATVTNLRDSFAGGTTPPPWRDDMQFEITSNGQAFMQTCRLGTPFPQDPIPSTPDPPSVMTILDEMGSPYADGPTSFQQVFTFTPDFTGDFFSIEVQACGGRDPAGGNCQVWCFKGACFEASPDPAANALPHAEFVVPDQCGAGGDRLPFEVRVLRNGYDPTRPLTVRVIPSNESDPLDLFPIDLNQQIIEVVSHEVDHIQFERFIRS